MRPLLTVGMLTVGLLSAVSGPDAAAQDMAPPAAKHEKHLQLLTAAELDPARLLPPPPPRGMTVEADELAELHAIQNQRTRERMAQALWDDGHEDATLYAGVLGSRFDLARLPVTARILALVANDEDIAGDMAKAHFKRPRPWSLDPTLKGCPYRPDANPLTSYPSGHAMAGYALGVVLADLVPGRAAAILERAQDYAFSRLVCGLHYRSDLAAGEVLGTVVAEDILHDPRMQADLSAARAELAAAGI